MIVNTILNYNFLCILFSMASKASGTQKRDGSIARHKAYLHIQRKVASGDLKPGQAVPELAIAKELGISRTPVREALGQLASEGILEQSPNRRATVVNLTRKDIIELYELREALEAYAVGKVARQPVRRAALERLHSLTEAILKLKEELEHSGKSELDDEQMRRFVASDLGFHTLLMRMAANDRILKVVNETRLMIRIFAMRRQGHGVPLLEDIYRQHTEVARAIAAQDPEGAMRAISEHIQVSLQERLEDFEHWEIETSLRLSIPLFYDVRRVPESQ